jgi:acetyltransferase-like isoleucine patch superfamily enzyme
MNPLRHISVAFDGARVRLTRRILSHRIRYRHTGLNCDPTAIWDYGYRDIDAISIGRNVTVRAFCEIIVYKTTRNSSIPGSLTLGDNCVISTGANIRAAGGHIEVGEHSVVAQHAVLLASTHAIRLHENYLNTPWDETRSGVTIGRNVWIGAGALVMPGLEIGSNAIVGAGSVVTKNIPADEIWAGVPARFVRAVG